MTEEVIVRTRYWQADCYHTQEDCPNRRRIKRPTQLSKKEAEDYGLTECTHCLEDYPEQNRTRDSLRYALSRGEVERDSD